MILLQSLYFSPLPPPRAIIPDPAPSVQLKIKIPVTIRRGISKRSHEKIVYNFGYLNKNARSFNPFLAGFEKQIKTLVRSCNKYSPLFICEVIVTKSPAIFERPYEKERSNRKSILVVVRSLIEELFPFNCYHG